MGGKAISGSVTKGLMGRAWEQEKVHSPNIIKNVHLANAKTDMKLLESSDLLSPGAVSNCSALLLGGSLQFPDPPRVLTVQYLRHFLGHTETNFLEREKYFKLLIMPDLQNGVQAPLQQGLYLLCLLSYIPEFSNSSN